MLVGNAEVAQPDGRVDIGTDTAQQFASVVVELGPVDQAEATTWGMAEKDVFGNRQLIEQHGFLMDRRDTGMGGGHGRREMGFFAINPDRATIRLIDAGEDLDERRLTRAVLTDQRRDGAGIQGERDTRECFNARKGLGNALKCDSGLHPRCGRFLQQEAIHRCDLKLKIIGRLSLARLPLTLALSPQAGRGDDRGRRLFLLPVYGEKVPDRADEGHQPASRPSKIRRSWRTLRRSWHRRRTGRPWRLRCCRRA